MKISINLILSRFLKNTDDFFKKLKYIFIHPKPSKNQFIPGGGLTMNYTQDNAVNIIFDNTG